MRRGLPPLLVVAFGVASASCAPEGPSAFVTYNLKPDSSCKYSPSASGEDTFWPTGQYDIAPGGKAGSTGCLHPYRVHLVVNSYLRSNSSPMLGRAEPNVLQLHSAKVELKTLQGQTLQFNDEDPPLPNPFLVTTTNSLFPATGNTPSVAIGTVEVIPSAYAPYLSDFVDSQILADIQIQGTTTGDVDIDVKPFEYPIDICDGCLTRCASKYDSTARDGLINGECADNSGEDYRWCFDPGC